MPLLIAEAFLFVCPAGRAHYARPPHKRRPVCGDPGSGGRSHTFLTGLDRICALVLPLVGIIFLPTNGRAKEDRPVTTGIHATKWPPHAQWARPAGHGL